MSKTFSLSQKYKRILQAMAIVVLIIYMTLVLYQNVYGFSSDLQVRISFA